MSNTNTKTASPAKVENLKKIFTENYIEKPTLVSNAKATN